MSRPARYHSPVPNLVLPALILEKIATTGCSSAFAAQLMGCGVRQAARMLQEAGGALGHNGYLLPMLMRKKAG